MRYLAWLLLGVARVAAEWILLLMLLRYLLKNTK